MKIYNKIRLYFWSTYYLRERQIFWRIYRIIKGALNNFRSKIGYHNKPGVSKEIDVNYSFPELSSQIHFQKIDLTARIFTFLNSEVYLSDEYQQQIRVLSEQPLLWQFHYHYHDYLISILESSHNSQEHNSVLHFIRNWISNFSSTDYNALKSSWHSYVISIRIEAWIRVICYCFKNGLRDEGMIELMMNGLLVHGIILRKNLEFGTLANHLFKNCKALILLGSFIKNTYSEEWFEKGIKIFKHELNEQILSDGCHFERSPMYHVGVLSDLLDIIEVLNAVRPDEMNQSMLISVRTMLSYIKTILHPDNEYPFLNDSTQSFVLNTKEVIQRGENLLLQFGFDSKTSSQDEDLNQIPPDKKSGLHIWRSEDLFVIFDAGLIGPDYQPGHAHADTFGYELSWKGNRWISDTGVYHYKSSDERRYSRSTIAHSTVCIDTQDQSEVWDNFRVGRRAKILFDQEYSKNRFKIFHSAHDGYKRLKGKIIHERAMIISHHNYIIVVDWLHGHSEHLVQNFIHFHPGISLSNINEDFFAQNIQNYSLRIASFGFNTMGKMLSTPYYPGFGKIETRSTLLFEMRTTLPKITAYLLSFDEIIPQIYLDEHNKLLQIRSHRNEDEVTISSLI